MNVREAVIHAGRQLAQQVEGQLMLAIERRCALCDLEQLARRMMCTTNPQGAKAYFLDGLPLVSFGPIEPNHDDLQLAYTQSVTHYHWPGLARPSCTPAAIVKF